MSHTSSSPHRGLVTLGQRGHEAVDVCLLCRGDDVLHADVGAVVPVPWGMPWTSSSSSSSAPSPNVLCYGLVEEHRLLRHDGQLAPQEGDVEALDVLAFHLQAATVQVVEPLEAIEVR